MPGKLAKIIHSIDKLDSTAEEQEPGRIATTFDLNDIRAYEEPQFLVITATSQYSLWPHTYRPLVKGQYRVFTHLAIRNQTQKTTGQYYTYPEGRTAEAVPSETIEGINLANRPVELIKNGRPLILARGESLGLQDLTWAAGQVVNYYYRFYEVKTI